MAIDSRVARIVATFPIAAVKVKLRELAEQQHPEIALYPGDYGIQVENDKLVMTFERDDA